MAATAMGEAGVPDGSERLHALDAVRAGALLLGVVFHATMSFLPGAQIWVVRDEQSPLLGAVFFVSHIFRMSLFFLIAGFFGRMACRRRGVRGFVRDRLKRIGVPLVALWLPLIVVLTAIFIWGAVTQYGLEAAKKMQPPAPRGSILESFPLTHLWFLYVLLWLYTFALGLRALLSRLAGGLHAALDDAVRSLVTSGLAPLALAVPTAIALYLREGWWLWLGVPTPDFGLLPNAPALTAFGTAFAFGWLLHRQPHLLELWRRRYAPHLAAAVALSAVCLSVAGVHVRLDASAQPADQAQRLLLALCYPLATWTWSIVLIGLAMRFLSRPWKPVRYLADASYWIYLVHLPIVMALQVAVFRLPLPAIAKFSLVLAIGFPPMLLSYRWFVRYTFVGALLNGRRHQRPRRATSAAGVLAGSAEGATGANTP